MNALIVLTRADEARYQSKVDKSAGPDGCWPWAAGRYSDGYGSFRLGNTTVGAHRVAAALSGMEIPPGMCVLHRCDNPPCCNPQHLTVGTREENNHDRVAKGRSATGHRNGRYTQPEKTNRGERHHFAKLSEADVSSILSDIADGVPRKAIAGRLGISVQHVGRIASGQHWPQVAREGGR